MKSIISIVFLFFFITVLGHAQSIDEKISINVSDLSIEAFLNQLSKDHNVSFSYSKDFVSLHKMVTINRINTSIRAILKESLSSVSIEFMVLGDLVVLKKALKLVNTSNEKPITKQATIASVVISKRQINKEPSKDSFGVNVAKNNQKISRTDSLNLKPSISNSMEPIEDSTTFRSVRKSRVSVTNNNEIDYRMPKIAVMRAFKNIKNNFHTKPYLFNGLYREIFEADNKTISLVDAAVDIYDKGYNVGIIDPKKPREKVKLRGVRASQHFLKDPFKKEFLNFNSLSALLRWNKIKYRDQNIESTIGKRKYKLDSIIQSSDVIIYVVSTSTPAQHHESKITYYIDALANTFLKIEYEEKARDGFYLNQEWRFSTDRTYYFKAKHTLLVYEFKAYEGKMYLGKCIEKSYADIYSTKTKSVEWEFGCSRTLIISDVKNWRNKSKNTIDMDVSKALVLQINEYNPSVWKKYDDAKLIPLATNQLSDLEIGTSLKQQFQEASKIY